MGLFSWLKRKNQKIEGKSATLTLDDVLRQANGGDLPISLSLKIETVFAALRDKSETIGQIPLKMYRKGTDKKGREEVKSGRNYRIFCEKPCNYMTTQTFMENLVVSLERYGAFYAYIERNDLGAPMSIIPFRFQGNIQPSMDVAGNVYYQYVKNDGTIGDAYNLEDIFIIKGFTLDGFTPVSPLVQNARLLGIANAQEETAFESQTDGITTRLYAKTDQVFADLNVIERMQAQFEGMRGPKGTKSIPVFEQNLTLHSLKLTPAETELLKSREFTVNRICRVFRVPVHRVGVTGTGTGIDIEKENEEYLRSSLNPILVKVEKALNELMPSGYEVEFDRNAFYAGSPWRLVEHVEKGVKGGLYSINEGRIALGEEPVAGGEVFCVDNNNVVYGSWNELEQMQERLYGNKPKPTEVNNNGQ
jgi:HK97 family phage portal protein